MDRKRRQKEQVSCSLDQKDSSRLHVLREETEPLLKFGGFGTVLLCIYDSTLLNSSYFLLLFFNISRREICNLFLLQCSHYELNFNLFYMEQVLRTSAVSGELYCSLSVQFTCILFYLSLLILISHGCRSNLFALVTITITNPEVNQPIMKFTA